MRAVEIKDGGILLREIRRYRATEAARTGLHVSTICDDWIKTRDAKRYAQEINSTSVIGFQEAGNVLEDFLGQALRRRFSGWRKPRSRSDERGVIGSPDGDQPARRTIHEIKLTWVSEGTEEKRPFILIKRGHVEEESLKFLRYRMQAMHYAYVWGYNRIQFHILFVNGNFRPPFPNFRTITLLPTQEELVHNARLIWQHAEDRGWLVRRKGQWIAKPPRNKPLAA